MLFPVWFASVPLQVLANSPPPGLANLKEHTGTKDAKASGSQSLLVRYVSMNVWISYLLIIDSSEMVYISGGLIYWAGGHHRSFRAVTFHSPKRQRFMFRSLNDLRPFGVPPWFFHVQSTLTRRALSYLEAVLPTRVRSFDVTLRPFARRSFSRSGTYLCRACFYTCFLRADQSREGKPRRRRAEDDDVRTPST